MTTKLETFKQQYLRKDLLEVRPGDIVRVHQKVKETDKERIQVFEGLVLAAKHGKGIQGTITVRKVAEGVGVERIFPLHSPLIEKIELVKHAKVRRAKLFYLRTAKGKRAKLKAKELGIAVAEPAQPATTSEMLAGEAGGEPAKEGTVLYPPK
ncbi:MAG: large subunit ribosomal protein L19 [Parcubacteria group bacterium Greene0714_21]|nr:MAG: large subunit ribosomal protein L19 [Parcubacteria group bacterium Greene0416_39]TSC98191.1 MAG: large subunit ribosomal protein L19 [Parcubacteria group bacterium Greene1014_47]TSD04061.1 MAG: large subunit ribosomal protein L19 [Parcubacteria group bacterium Greene0714_21]